MVLGAHDNSEPLLSLAYPLICSSSPRWLRTRALLAANAEFRIRACEAPARGCTTALSDDKTNKPAKRAVDGEDRSVHHIVPCFLHVRVRPFRVQLL